MSSTCLCSVFFSKTNEAVLNQRSWCLIQTFRGSCFENCLHLKIFPFTSTYIYIYIHINRYIYIYMYEHRSAMRKCRRFLWSTVWPNSNCQPCYQSQTTRDFDIFFFITSQDFVEQTLSHWVQNDGFETLCLEIGEVEPAKPGTIKRARSRQEKALESTASASSFSDSQQRRSILSSGKSHDTAAHASDVDFSGARFWGMPCQHVKQHHVLKDEVKHKWHEWHTDA